MSNSNKSFDARAQSVVMQSLPVTSANNTRKFDGQFANRFDAAIGFGSGLMLGGALWALGYLLFSLVI
jgi:hypothetical protein